MNKKLLLIMAVICTILALIAGSVIWSSLNVAHHVHMIGANNMHIYAETDTRLSINRQLTAGIYYLTSGDKHHKKDFKDYGISAEKAFDKWTTLLGRSGKKDMRDKQQKLDGAEYLRQQYHDVIKIITGAFGLLEAGRKEDALRVASEKVYPWIDDILLSEFDKAVAHDVHNNSMCYTALLSSIGAVPWSARESIKQVEIAQAEMRYFLALDIVRSHVTRQLNDTKNYLTSGTEHIKRDFKGHTLYVKMALNKGLEAVEFQNDIGFEGAKKNLEEISGIESKYNSIVKLYEKAFKLKSAGETGETFKLAEEKIETLNEELFPLINKALKDNKRKINEAHEKLKNYTFSAGVQSIVTLTIISLVIVFLIFTIIRRILVSLKKLRAGTELIGNGRLDHRIDLDSGDELGLLAHSFNEMTEALQKITVSREQYQRQNEFLNHIVESIYYPFYVVDTNDYKIKLANFTTDRTGEWKDKTCYSLTHHSDKPCESKDHACPLKLVKESRQPVVLEHLHYDNNGKLKHYEVHGHPVFNDNGDVIQMIEHSIDITERKMAENELTASSEKLRQSNLEMNRFIYIASHDLQEPMRKVTVFGDLLISKYAASLGDQGKDYLQKMQRATEHMQTLINDLLSFSRVITKAQPYTSVDLSTVLQGVLSDFEVYIERVKGRVEASDLPTIDADPLQIRQLFQNLIDNALKFHKTDEPPVVKIYGALSLNNGKNPDVTVSDGDFYDITIEDNGIGFDEKYEERIFGVFQRLHSLDEYEGNGMGLSVCKKIVERHGGTIKAKSRSGKGSSFIVTLPVKQTSEVICNVG